MNHRSMNSGREGFDVCHIVEYGQLLRGGGGAAAALVAAGDMTVRSASLLVPELLCLLLCLPSVSGKFSSGSFHLDAGDFLHGPEYLLRQK